MAHVWAIKLKSPKRWMRMSLLYTEYHIFGYPFSTIKHTKSALSLTSPDSRYDKPQSRDGNNQLLMLNRWLAQTIPIWVGLIVALSNRIGWVHRFWSDWNEFGLWLSWPDLSGLFHANLKLWETKYIYCPSVVAKLVRDMSVWIGILVFEFPI